MGGGIPGRGTTAVDRERRIKEEVSEDGRSEVKDKATSNDDD